MTNLALPTTVPVPQNAFISTILRSSGAEQASAAFLRPLTKGRIKLGGSVHNNRFFSVFKDMVSNFRAEPLKSTGSLILSFLFFAIFVGQQAPAIFSVSIIGSNIVHSKNPHSGFWFPEVLDDPLKMANTSIFGPIYDFHNEIAAKSIYYANHCYLKESGQQECSIFRTPKLPITEHNVSCPFAENTVCDPDTTPFMMDTGYISCRLLDINEKHVCQFRVRKTCAVLATDDRFVSSRQIDKKGTKYVEYFYGDIWGNQKKQHKTFGETIHDPQKQRGGEGEYIIRSVKQHMRPVEISKRLILRLGKQKEF